MSKRRSHLETAGPGLQCSFCGGRGKSLISTPGIPPAIRAYICEDCVLACATLLPDDRAVEGSTALDHPLAPDLMQAAADWVAKDAAGADSSAELSNLRAVAAAIFRESR